MAGRVGIKIEEIDNKDSPSGKLIKIEIVCADGASRYRHFEDSDSAWTWAHEAANEELVGNRNGRPRPGYGLIS